MRWILRQDLRHGLADCGVTRCRVGIFVDDLFGAATPDQFAVLAVEQVNLQGRDFIVHAAGFGVQRRTPVTAPRATPATAPTSTIVIADQLLAVFDDQVSLHFHISIGARLRHAQAALIELPGNRLADPLLGTVTFDPWVIRLILQSGFFPAPAAIAAKVAMGIEVMVDLVGFTSTEQYGKHQHSEAAEHGSFSGGLSRRVSRQGLLDSLTQGFGAT